MIYWLAVSLVALLHILRGAEKIATMCIWKDKAAYSVEANHHCGVLRQIASIGGFPF